MKHAKKLASLLLVLVMVLSLGITAFAATGTITIENPVDGETYTAYKIFSVVYDTKEVDGTTVAGDHYSYTITPSDPWFNDVKNYIYSTYSTMTKTFAEGTIPADATTYTGNGLTMSPNADKTVYTVTYNSAAFQADLFAKNLNTKKTGKSGTTLTKDATSNAVSATGLDLGYYLVDTTLGSLCSLDTTNPTVAIQEKNTAPTNEKKVQVDSENWGTENNTTINKVVNFKSTITVGGSTEILCFHDEMSAGLTFLKDAEHPVVISLEPEGASTKPTTLTEGTDYEVVKNPKKADNITAEGCTFHIEFKDPFFQKLGKGNNTVVVKYSARLNKNAVIATTGNTNTSKVSYGENNQFTKDSTTKTYTYEIPVFKFATEKNVEKPLSDTHFKLYTRTGTGDYTTLVKLVVVSTGVEAGKDDVKAVYRVATDDEIAEAAKAGSTVKIVDEIITNNSGKFTIQGLALGTYRLTETAAHDGYNMLPAPLHITIQKNKDTGAIEIFNDDDKKVVDEIKIENKTGLELPSTGGMGTTIFYVVGSILLIGAAVLLITKKRMNAAKESK